MARGMIPGKAPVMPMQGTVDPATQLIAKNGGKQPPKKNSTAIPKGAKKKAPPLKAAPKGGKGNPFAKPAFGGGKI